jgi:hypothetical protein
MRRVELRTISSTGGNEMRGRSALIIWSMARAEHCPMDSGTARIAERGSAVDDARCRARRKTRFGRDHFQCRNDWPPQPARCAFFPGGYFERVAIGNDQLHLTVAWHVFPANRPPRRRRFPYFSRVKLIGAAKSHSISRAWLTVFAASLTLR